MVYPFPREYNDASAVWIIVAVVSWIYAEVLSSACEEVMMLKDFVRYWHLLWRDIPLYIFESLGVVFCIGAVALLYLKGFKSGWRYVSGLLLAEYVFVLYCSTVLFRHVSSVRECDFSPFWSYRAYFCGEDTTLLAENIMNIVVFIPVGLLLGLSSRSMIWPRVLLIGVGLSVGIESLQFIFLRGFSEFDDVMHNSLGCVMGYALFRLISRLTTKRYGYTDD